MGRTGKTVAWILGLVGGAAAVAGVAYAASGGGTVSTPSSGSGGTLPPGPYTLLPNGAPLQPGHTYLLSKGTTGIGNLGTALQDVRAEIQSDGTSILGSWIGLPPPGWPSSDPNALAGIFVALTNTTGKVSEATTGLVVYATGGQTS
jgi:hypothetical protein